MQVLWKGLGLEDGNAVGNWLGYVDIFCSLYGTMEVVASSVRILAVIFFVLFGVSGEVIKNSNGNCKSL